MSHYLSLESQTLLMHRVSSVKMQIFLQRSPGLLLCIRRIPRVAVVESIAVVPVAAVRLPLAQTYPAEFPSTVLIATSHMVAASVLLDCHLE